MNDLDKIVNHRLAMVSLLSRRLVYRIIAESGINITPEQWTLLYYLWKENGQSIGELVKATQKDFANVTRIVEKLVEHGYVKKERDVNDNRSFRIFILPKANEIKKDIEKVQEKMQYISLSGISDDEQILIMRILDKIEENILNKLTVDNK